MLEPDNVKVPAPATVSPPGPSRLPAKIVPDAPLASVPPKVTVPPPASEEIGSLSKRASVPRLLTVTPLLVASAPPPLIASVPAVIVVAPANVFAPVSASVPAPCLVSA